MVALGGCSGDDPIDIQIHNGTTALVCLGAELGFDAEARGVVQTGAGGCLVVVVEGTTRPVPLI